MGAVISLSQIFGNIKCSLNLCVVHLIGWASQTNVSGTRDIVVWAVAPGTSACWGPGKAKPVPVYRKCHVWWLGVTSAGKQQNVWGEENHAWCLSSGRHQCTLQLCVKVEWQKRFGGEELKLLRPSLLLVDINSLLIVQSGYSCALLGHQAHLKSLNIYVVASITGPGLSDHPSRKAEGWSSGLRQTLMRVQKRAPVHVPGCLL